MARTKESLSVDEEDRLRETNTSLLNKNRGMCPVPPQGVLKGPNTSFAAAISCDPPETVQMTTQRKEGGFRRKIGSHLFRRIIRARFGSSPDIKNPPTLPTPIPSSNGPYPASSVASSSQGSSGKHAQARPTVQRNHLVHEITSRSRPLSTSRRSSSLAPAEEQPEGHSDLIDLGHGLKSAFHSMLQVYPKYIGFIVYSHSSSCR